MLNHRPPHFLEGARLRGDAAARLLLLLAKPHLNATQGQAARTLAARVEDWDDLAALSARKFVAPYLYRHLRTLAHDVVPAPALARLQSLAHASVLSTLRVVGVQLGFHEKCIAATGARHAYIKGCALAVQSGQDIGERFCRDIDVLVHDADFRGVIDAAVQQGYSVHAEDQHITDAADLAFLSRYADVVTLAGRERIPIEVHRRLDKRAVVFDPKAALATTEEIVLSGRKIRTLSKALHFTYASYHHSRHYWSKLHWLTDIHALQGAQGFDALEVTRLADKIGIRPTIDATFEFCDLTAAPGLWGEEVPLHSKGGQFLGACLFNLGGELELEQSLRTGRSFGDFMSAWQVSSNRQAKFGFNRWLNRLHPTPRQYLRWRLPPALRWIYYLRNALTVARIGLIGSAPTRAADAQGGAHDGHA